MIGMVHRILKFCGGRFAAKIRIAYLFSFLKSICQNAPVFVAVWIIRKLMDGTADVITCCLSAAVLLVFFALGTVFQNLTDRFQSATGYEVFVEKRKDFPLVKIETEAAAIVTGTRKQTVNDDIEKGECCQDEQSSSCLLEWDGKYAGNGR